MEGRSLTSFVRTTDARSLRSLGRGTILSLVLDVPSFVHHPSSIVHRCFPVRPSSLVYRPSFIRWPTFSIVHNQQNHRSIFPFSYYKKTGRRHSIPYHILSSAWHSLHCARLRASELSRQLRPRASPREDPSCGSGVIPFLRIQKDMAPFPSISPFYVFVDLSAPRPVPRLHSGW